jgi:hypothetical protein
MHPSRFGAFSSNGCIGLLNQDAAWFWSFAVIGTPVHIRSINSPTMHYVSGWGSLSFQTSHIAS